MADHLLPRQNHIQEMRRLLFLRAVILTGMFIDHAVLGRIIYATAPIRWTFALPHSSEGYEERFGVPDRV